MKETTLIFNKLVVMVLVLTSSFIIIQSCSTDDDHDQISIDDQLIVKYLNDNGIDAEKAAHGIYYTVLESNDSGSQVEDEDILSVYYKMNLLDGTLIDNVPESSGIPSKFKNTEQAIIPVGLRLASSMMKEGEKYRFFIPSYLAYGNYSYEDIIPANAIFIIENEIVKIETEDEQKVIEKDSIDSYIADNGIEDMTRISSGLYYKEVVEGEGDNPEDGDTVKIQFVAKYLNGDVLDSTTEDEPFSFTIGSDSVINGLEEGVKLMKAGGTVSLIIPSDLAYDKGLKILPEVVREDLLERTLISEKTPPFSILTFDIELEEIN